VVDVEAAAPVRSDGEDSEHFSRQNAQDAPADPSSPYLSPTFVGPTEAEDDERFAPLIFSPSRLSLDFLLEDNQESKKRGRSSKQEGAGTKKPRAKPDKKVAGETLEMHRRAVGDAVKQKIEFEKWAIHADTHTEIAMEAEVFRELVCASAASDVPRDWSADSKIVFANATREGIAAICGSSKFAAARACRRGLPTTREEGSANLADYALRLLTTILNTVRVSVGACGQP
jgi:hypothetical protein